MIVVSIDEYFLVHTFFNEDMSISTKTGNRLKLPVFFVTSSTSM